MGSYGIIMAAVAATFTATDCLVEGLRRASHALLLPSQLAELGMRLRVPPEQSAEPQPDSVAHFSRATRVSVPAHDDPGRHVAVHARDVVWEPVKNCS